MIWELVLFAPGFDPVPQAKETKSQIQTETSDQDDKGTDTIEQAFTQQDTKLRFNQSD